MAKELLVTRPTVYFNPIDEGRLLQYSEVPDGLQQPLVRGTKKDIKGYGSGWRSGLLQVGSELYKLKGCRPAGSEYQDAPLGSQALSVAQLEAERTLEVREALLRDGLSYPMEPTGLWVYDHILFRGEPNAATIYRVDGDTRIDEFLWLMDKLPYEYIPDEKRERIAEVFQTLGIMTGQALRQVHDRQFCWDSDSEPGHANNAHLGNVVVFPDKSGHVQVQIVDFTNSVSAAEEKQDAIAAIQKYEAENLKKWVHSPNVVSRAGDVTSDPKEALLKLMDRVINTRLPGLSANEQGLVISYILKHLQLSNPSSIRELFAESLERGYEHSAKPPRDLLWEDVADLKNDVRNLRSAFVHQAARVLGNQPDKEKILTLAQRSRYFAGYRFPRMIDPEVTTLPLAQDSHLAIETDNRKDQVVELVSTLVSLHQDYLSDQPATGKQYFSFPPVTPELLTAHNQLEKHDIADIINLWVKEDLEEILDTSLPQRAIGHFMLTVAQTNSQHVEEALINAISSPDYPDLVGKLTRLAQWYKLLPPITTTKQHGYMGYLYDLMENRREAFSLENETEKRAAIALFGRGIITEDLQEIFNHRLLDIVINEFTPQQIPALEAALTNPKLVDRLSDPEVLLQLALTGAQVKDGQTQDVSLMHGEEYQEMKAAYFKYFFASEDKDLVADLDLKQALESPTSSGWIAHMMERLLIAEKPLHPNSFLAETLRNSTFEVNDLVNILKVALDMSDGNLETTDPTILSLLETSSFEGTISAGNMTNLVQACIGFGVEIPDVLLPHLTRPENHQAVVNFLSTKVYRRKGIYERLPAYPTNPIYAFISHGLSALPTVVGELTTEQMANSEAMNALVPGIIDSLFKHDGYFQNYFGSLGNHEDYPDPEISMKEMYQSGWQFWRIVHQDVWDILNSADPQVLANVFRSKVTEANIRINFLEKTRGTIGYRDTSVEQCLPPHIWEKILAIKPRKN